MTPSPPVSALSRPTCFAIKTNLGGAIALGEKFEYQWQCENWGIGRADCPVRLLRLYHYQLANAEILSTAEAELKVSGGLTQPKSELPFVVVAR
jgi:hypothetical protein